MCQQNSTEPHSKVIQAKRTDLSRERDSYPHPLPRQWYGENHKGMRYGTLTSCAHYQRTIIHGISRFLRTRTQYDVTITQKHIRGRLAETILGLKANYGIENDGKTLNVIMNRYDLASLSNMSTSNAIRTLSSFATEGLIEISGRKIRILSEEYLAKISRLG